MGRGRVGHWVGGAEEGEANRLHTCTFSSGIIKMFYSIIADLGGMNITLHAFNISMHMYYRYFHFSILVTALVQVCVMYLSHPSPSPCNR